LDAPLIPDVCGQDFVSDHHIIIFAPLGRLLGSLVLLADFARQSVTMSLLAGRKFFNSIIWLTLAKLLTYKLVFWLI
jgi:hypothetical protein